MPKKQQSSNRKTQYGTSYPTHLTRLEEQMKILPYLPYIGMALKLCTCRLFTRTTCSLLLPGLELNMTFPFRPYKVCPFHSDIKTSLQLRSMGWILANLAVTPPHRTSSTLKMSPSCQGILHHWNRPTMMSVQIPPTDEIDQSFIIFLIGRREINIFTCLLSSSIPYGRKNLGYKRGFLWHTEWQHLSPGE